MGEQRIKRISEEWFYSRNLYHFIVNSFTMYLTYGKDKNNHSKLDDYKEEINEILQHISLDNQIFNELLSEYISPYYQRMEEKELTLKEVTERRKLRKISKTPLETYILDYHRKTEERLRNIPNSLEKAKEILLGMISTYDPRYFNDQVLDALVLLKDNIPQNIIKKINEDWEEEVRYYYTIANPTEPFFSKIFWSSSFPHEQIDAVSRYRFKTTFNIDGFEFAFEDVEHQLEELILETRGGVLGSYDLWLISRSRELSNELAGIDLTLRGYVKNQHEYGYWRNENRLDLDSPDIFTTVLITLNLLKLSPSMELRQSGVKGAKWIRNNQNSDGSWSFQTKKGKSKPDIFTTILCLEALKRSGVENIEEGVKNGENWIMDQQTDIGLWEDDSIPFPFLTVLVLEYFHFKDLLSHELPLFKEDLIPSDIVLLGMKRAIEISKNCVSEEGKISPKVGAIVIKDDQIILEAYRGETSPGDHAEYIAIEIKAKDIDLEDSILITTLEPCTSRGPIKIPCAQRIVDAGINKVWYGIVDPNPKIRGKGELYLTEHGVSVGRFLPSLSKEIKDINTEFWNEQIKNYYEDTTESQIDIMAINNEGEE